jgi:hypothetical protein
MGEFTKSIEAYIEKTTKNADSIFKETVSEVFTRIVDKTPVDVDDTKHRGKTKGNWQIGIDSIPTEVLDSSDPSGSATKSRELSKLKNAEETVYIVHNEPHIHLLEFGLYPKPGGPKTANGYSTQAPKGMVRTTLNEFNTIFKRVVNSKKGV